MTIRKVCISCLLWYIIHFEEISKSFDILGPLLFGAVKLVMRPRNATIVKSNSLPVLVARLTWYLQQPSGYHTVLRHELKHWQRNKNCLLFTQSAHVS